MCGKLFFGILFALTLGLGATNTAYGEDSSLAYEGKDRLAQRVFVSPFQSPEKVYDKVWTLIKDEFYETSYNHQDWQRWRHKYDGKLKTPEDAHKAIETMLYSLHDRYTRFLDEDAFDDERQQIDAQICGIGVQIGIKKDKIIIIAPIEDTPAFQAGVQPLDEVTAIDGKSTRGFSVDDAAKQIRGKINTPVELTLSRDGKKLVKVIKRAEIPLKAVQTVKMLDGEVGYIRLSSFISQRADEEMIDSIKKLSGAKGLVLDLRGNPGGLLNNAIKIAGLFLKSSTMVFTVDRDGYKIPMSSSGGALCELPLAVLIDKGSASASEITSGALKDYNRAVLVGEKTFGKGLVQGINKLEDGTGVNITIASYRTPANTDIHQKGIAPDFEVKLTKKDREEHKGPWWADPDGPATKREPEDLKDIQLKKAVDVLHESLATGSTVAMLREAKK